MDIKQTGIFIAELRKRKNMTQKELASKLNVTDKAVSKWERGLGYPEVTTIPILAEVLGVSSSEIILGQQANDNPDCDEPSDIQTTDSIVTDTVEYMVQLHDQQKIHSKNIVFAFLTAVFLIGIFVCCLCDYLIDKEFSWSLYVLGSEVTAWLIIMPFLKLNHNRSIVAMAALTVSIFPLLLLIEYLCPLKKWVIPFALPILIISLISLWISILLFIYTKIRRLYLVSFEFFFWGVIDNLIIQFFVNNYLMLSPSAQENLPNIIVAVSCGFISFILLTVAVLKKGNESYESAKEFS